MASASASPRPGTDPCSVKNSKLGLAEPLLKLHRVARHRSNPQKQPHIPVLYHTLMAEDFALQIAFQLRRIHNEEAVLTESCPNTLPIKIRLPV
jgi:hypothetical protein